MASATKYSAFPPDPKSPITSSSPTGGVVVVVVDVAVVEVSAVDGSVVDVAADAAGLVDAELVVVVEVVAGGVVATPPVVHPPRRITSAISTRFIALYSGDCLTMRLEFAATITGA
jgi:hypothetical protein